MDINAFNYAQIGHFFTHEKAENDVSHQPQSGLPSLWFQLGTVPVWNEVLLEQKKEKLNKWLCNHTGPNVRVSSRDFSMTTTRKQH